MQVSSRPAGRSKLPLRVERELVIREMVSKFDKVSSLVDTRSMIYEHLHIRNALQIKPIR